MDAPTASRQRAHLLRAAHASKKPAWKGPGGASRLPDRTAGLSKRADYNRIVATSKRNATRIAHSAADIEWYSRETPALLTHSAALDEDLAACKRYTQELARVVRALSARASRAEAFKPTELEQLVGAVGATMSRVPGVSRHGLDAALEDLRVSALPPGVEVVSFGRLPPESEFVAGGGHDMALTTVSRAAPGATTGGRPPPPPPTSRPPALRPATQVAPPPPLPDDSEDDSLPPDDGYQTAFGRLLGEGEAFGHALEAGERRAGWF